MSAPNWSNQTIWTGDNLDIMRGMNSASVDLIYADPPFNSKANYAAPIGSKAAGAAFKDTWGLDDVNLAWHGEIKHEHPGLYDLLNATRQIHGDSMMSYLIYMAIRIMEMRRLLNPETGSIYLHCDPTASHYLKLLMDSVFGRASYTNEIVWQRTASRNDANRWGAVHDTLLFYAYGSDCRWNRIYTPHNPDYVRKFYRNEDERGRWMSDVIERSASMGARPNLSYEFCGYTPKWGWRVKREKLEALDREGKILWSRNGKPRLKRYLHEQSGVPVRDVITDVRPLSGHAKERTGYPTQKPLALIRRIVRASSNEGDTILDPFCGCATACIAAELEQREWAGIDISAKAADLVKDRMEREVRLFFKGAHRTDIPARTDLGKVISYNDAKNKRFLYGEQGGYCHGCEHHFELRNMTVDHIIPRSKGGTDHISNLQLLCAACNSLKGDRPQEYLLACLTDKGWIKRKKAA